MTGRTRTRRRSGSSGPFTVESLSPHMATVTPVRSESEKTATMTMRRLLSRASSTTCSRPGSRTGGRRSGWCSTRWCRSPGSSIQGEGIQKETGAQRIAVSDRAAVRDRGPGVDQARGAGGDPRTRVRRAAGVRVRVRPAGERVGQGVRDRAGADPAGADELRPGDGRRAAEEDRDRGTCSRSSASRTSTIDAGRRRAHRRDQGRGRLQPDDRGDPVLGTGEIALWMIDTDYDGESFFVRHCYFTGDNDPYKRLKAALKADIDQDGVGDAVPDEVAAVRAAGEGEDRRQGDQPLRRRSAPGLRRLMDRYTERAAGGDRDSGRAAADRGVRGVGQDAGDLAADRGDPEARPGSSRRTSSRSRSPRRRRPNSRNG